MKRILCLPFLILGFFAPSMMAYADDTPFSDARKSEIGEIVKSYLMSHPEIIQDALNELEKRQRDAEANAQKAALASVGPDLVKAENGIVLGNPAGDVTLVEFFDYNCGYCKKSLSDVMNLMKDDPKLRIILRDFPVLGPDSIEASKVALAVRAQISGFGSRQFRCDFHDRFGRG